VQSMSPLAQCDPPFFGRTAVLSGWSRWKLTAASSRADLHQGGGGTFSEEGPGPCLQEGGVRPWCPHVGCEEDWLALTRVCGQGGHQ
jgi:hypothetical protein